MNTQTIKYLKPDEKLNTLSPRTYAKSNTLIQAKGRASALSYKLLALAIREAKMENGDIVAIFSGKTLRKLLGTTSGNLYVEIQHLIKPNDPGKSTILDWKLYIENDEQQRLIGMNVVTTAEFKNGILKLTLNKALASHIFNLKANYTVLSLTEVFALSSGYSVHMYEIFRSYIDREKALGHGTESDVFSLYYNLDELRVEVGVDYPDQKKDRKYLKYAEFRRNVLERIKTDISACTSIIVEYQTEKKGRSVTGIRFLLREKLPKEQQIGDVKSQNDSILEAIRALLAEEHLPDADLEAIYESADGNLDKVCEAYDASQKAGKIDNFTGWMIAAIKNGYATRSKKSSIEKNRTAEIKKDSFNNFEQNTYDFEKLEKSLLNN